MPNDFLLISIYLMTQFEWKFRTLPVDLSAFILKLTASDLTFAVPFGLFNRITDEFYEPSIRDETIVAEFISFLCQKFHRINPV